MRGAGDCYGPPMRSAALFSVIALSFAALAGPAHAAPPRAWAVAKADLPDDAKFVFGFDLAAIQKTQLFATYFPKLREQPEISDALTLLKDSCQLDPLAVIRGAVVALSDDQHDGAVYLALAGLDRDKLATCIKRTEKTKHADAAAYTVKQDGNVTEIAKAGDTIFLGWAGKDVLVVPVRSGDRPALVKWLGGKGAFAKSELAKTIAKINTGAAFWAAGQADKEIQPGVTAKGAYGTVTVAKGALAADLHAIVGSAEQAQTLTKLAQDQLSGLVGMASSPAAPPGVAALVKAITVAAERDEVRVTASVAEQDVLAVINSPLFGAGEP